MDIYLIRDLEKFIIPLYLKKSDLKYLKKGRSDVKFSTDHEMYDVLLMQLLSKNVRKNTPSHLDPIGSILMRSLRANKLTVLKFLKRTGFLQLWLCHAEMVASGCLHDASYLPLFAWLCREKFSGLSFTKQSIWDSPYALSYIGKNVEMTKIVLDNGCPPDRLLPYTDNYCADPEIKKLVLERMNRHVCIVN